MTGRSAEPADSQGPMAKVQPTALEKHGHVRIDNYHWLNQRDDVNDVYVAGFGTTTDEHMNQEYYIMGRTWDLDVERVQFQWRDAGSSVETDWTGIGLSQRINGDSTCWMTTWDASGDV